VTLVCTRHSDPAIPIAPLQLTTVRVVCENTLNVALREKGLGRQFRRFHKFDPATLERDAKEFWGVTLQAMESSRTAIDRSRRRGYQAARRPT